MSAVEPAVSEEDGAVERVTERVSGSVGHADTRGAVVVVLRGRGADVARVAAAVAGRLGRPLFRLALADLVLPPAERVVALERLLGAATLAGAAVLVEGADGFTGDDERLARLLRDRFEQADGLLVVLDATGEGYHPAIAARAHVVDDAD